MDLIRSAEVAKKIGRIAQLEERCPYKAEVTGSIPVPPTIQKLVRRNRKCACCAEDLFLHAGIDRRPTISSCRAAVLQEIDFTGPSFSLVRTPDCQSGGRGFKSRRPRHFLSPVWETLQFTIETGVSVEEGEARPVCFKLVPSNF